MIGLSKVSKAYGSETVLDDVSLDLSGGERIGLVGPNGVGKSTLLKILAGVETIDRGHVTVEPGISLGYLPQDFSQFASQTVANILDSARGRTAEIRQRADLLERELARPDAVSSSSYQAQFIEYLQCLQKLEHVRQGDYLTRMDRILRGLNLSSMDEARPIDTLSGGEKMRVWLAKLFIEDPEVMLLDEPTNHLDLAALEWLESFILSNAEKCFVIVSHDRMFLDRTTTAIIAIDPQHRQLRRYGGNYSFYLERHASEMAKYREDYERQQQEMRSLDATIKQTQHALRYGGKRSPRDNDKFASYFKGQRAGSASGRKVRQARERLEDLKEEALERPLEEWKIRPVFTTDYYAGDTILSLDHISKTISRKTLFTELTAVVAKRDRIVVMGPNGAGKTSLLRIIAGMLSPDSGCVRLGLGIKVGYMSQEQETLRPDRTVLEEFRDGLVGYEDELRRDLWNYALLGPKAVDKLVRQVSPGERARLQLAKLVANGANFLLLDEPTNHLDVDSQEQMQSAVAAFEGPIIVVSHDRWFVDRIADAIWFLNDGVLSRRLGNYSDNSEWLKGLSKRA